MVGKRSNCATIQQEAKVYLRLCILCQFVEEICDDRLNAGNLSRCITLYQSNGKKTNSTEKQHPQLQRRQCRQANHSWHHLSLYLLPHFATSSHRLNSAASVISAQRRHYLSHWYRSKGLNLNNLHKNLNLP